VAKVERIFGPAPLCVCLSQLELPHSLGNWSLDMVYNSVTCADLVQHEGNSVLLYDLLG